MFRRVTVVCAAVVVGLAIIFGPAVASATAAPLSGAITSVSIRETTAGQYDTMHLDMTYAVPQGAHVGDTFVLTLPPQLSAATGLTFPLKDPSGAVVANAVIGGQTVTYTLTDYVQTHDHVTGSSWVEVEWDTSQVKPGTTVTLTFNVNGSTTTDTVSIPPADPGPGSGGPHDTTVTANKYMGYTDTPESSVPSNAHLYWGIQSGTITQAMVGTTLTILDSPSSPGQQIYCPSVGADWFHVDPATGDWVGDGELTAADWTLTCSTSKATGTLVIPASAVGKSLNFWGRSLVTDSSLTTFTNAGTVTINGTTEPVGAKVIRTGAGGDGSGVQSVSVGDYVWIDSDRDGVQDAGEPGIKAVTLTVLRPDGAPVATAADGAPYTATTTTDAAGHYLFANLPVLPAGQHYTVTIDSGSAALTGLSPTTTGQGTRATDSSTGSAVSTDLTTNGASDLTLDFGFVQPVIAPPPAPHVDPQVEPRVVPAPPAQVAPPAAPVAVAPRVVGTAVLAHTGSESGHLAVAGAVAVAGGILLVVLGRRRPERV